MNLRLTCFAPSALIAASMLPACASAPRSDADAPTVATLARYLTGSFSSAAQAVSDPENFRDIRLHAVEIWTHRLDGPWLYVEQAAAESLARPYRQRVYRLSEPGRGVYRSEVYAMPDPLRFAGWWRTPERFFGALTPDELDPREGCSIEMTYRDGVFTGGTIGTGCESTLRGAAYATSAVELFPDRLVTWDRGFDGEDQQVWGATEGGYIFLRLEDKAPNAAPWP